MENRMPLIFDAASRLFINKGYARTQMKDIAKEIGLSTGMLYVYFTGKRDILHFILKGTIDPAFITQDMRLPILPEQFAGLDDAIMEAFEQNARQFAAHLDSRTSYPLEQMLSDAFDVIANYGVGCLLIEKNPVDMGRLTEYYIGYRRTFFRQVLAYVTRYIDQGTFRNVEHPEHCTRLIIEILSWWGMHMRYDSFAVEEIVPLPVAKQVCLDNLLHAYQI